MPLLQIIIAIVQIAKLLYIEYERALGYRFVSQLSVTACTVIRDNTTVDIDPVLLVPGDIVVLKEGMTVPADVRLISVDKLSVSETLITGVQAPAAKITRAIRNKRILPLRDRTNMAYMSTKVATGSGVGIVVNTGLTTQIAQIISHISKPATTRVTHNTPHTHTRAHEKHHQRCKPSSSFLYSSSRCSYRSPVRTSSSLFSH